MSTCNIKTIFNIPNTIGLFRILLLYIALFSCNVTFLFCYSLSSVLDAVDGKMARKYNQSTFLGSCLDMITDRTSTILIYMKIISNNHHLYTFLTFTLVTDILSHFLYFSYAISNKTHHKQPNNFLLNIYYKKNTLLILCTSTEIFFIMLFINNMVKIYNPILYFLGFFSLIKTFFHVVQFYVAICKLSLHVENDNSKVNKNK